MCAFSYFFEKFVILYFCCKILWYYMLVSYCVRRFIINLLLFDILFANLILDFTV